jgi:uncharacterized protein
MKHTLALIALILVMGLLPGCRGDRENPTATTDSDRVMASYLASIKKMGELLAEVDSEAQAREVSPQVLLIIQDMRDLIPRTKKFSHKQQAETMSKYRVKSNKVNEQFAKDIIHFVAIPGASEDLVKQLKSLPPVFISKDTAN